MEIDFSGQYDRTLFFRSVRLANSPAHSRRFIYLLIFGVLFAVIYSTVTTIIETQDFTRVWLHLAVIVIMGYFLLQPYLLPYFAARRMWANPSVQRSLQGRANNKGITYFFTDSRNEIRWERFKRVRRTADLVTLVTVEGLLTIFPRHFFKSDSHWKKFNQLVSEKVIPSR